MTLRSLIFIIPLVSVRDTPIPYIYVSVRDTRSPNSTCRFVTPDPLHHSLNHQAFSIPRHHQSHYFNSSSLLLYQGIINPIALIHQAFFYTKASSLIMYIKVSFQDLGFNIFIMLILSQSHNHIHANIQLSI